MIAQSTQRIALKHAYDLLWAMCQNGGIPAAYIGAINSLLQELFAALKETSVEA